MECDFLERQLCSNPSATTTPSRLSALSYWCANVNQTITTKPLFAHSPKLN